MGCFQRNYTVNKVKQYDEIAISWDTTIQYICNSQYQPKPKDIGHVENKVPINIFNLHLVYQMDGDISLWLGMYGM